VNKNLTVDSRMETI